MLNLNSVMIGASDPKTLSNFYEKVLGKKPDMQEGDWYGYSAGAAYLSIGKHDKVTGESKNPERIIFNFETDDVKGEAERITKLGAKVIAAPYQMDGSSSWIATFADPEGNYFQLMSPWK